MTTTASEAQQSAMRLRRAVLVMARRLRRTLQGSGLSAAKLSVVGQLYRVGPMTPTELAAREGVKVATLTRLIAELDRDGWLDRAADVADGRRSILRLTVLGRKRLIASAQETDAALAAAVSTVAKPAELPTLRQACGLLERINDALGGHAETLPAAVQLTSKSRRQRT